MSVGGRCKGGAHSCFKPDFQPIKQIVEGGIEGPQFVDVAALPHQFIINILMSKFANYCPGVPGVFHLKAGKPTLDRKRDENTFSGVSPVPTFVDSVKM